MEGWVWLIQKVSQPIEGLSQIKVEFRIWFQHDKSVESKKLHDNIIESKRLSPDLGSKQNSVLCWTETPGTCYNQMGQKLSWYIYRVHQIKNNMNSNQKKKKRINKK